MNKKWDGNFYDEKHAYVSRYGSPLLDLLPVSRESKLLLDLGCGTGDLTKKIADLGFAVKGIDQSADMIKKAKEKYGNINFAAGDIREIDFHEEVDVVFSNATFHWIKETEELMANIWRTLKPKGELIFEMGGAGNIKIILEGIYQALEYFNFPQNKKNNPWRFLSPEDLTEILKKQGFVIHQMDYFERPTELEQGERGLENWLMMFASFFFDNFQQATLKEAIAYIEEKTKPFLYEKNCWHADYKRLRVRAEKR